jgi:hypothetical protein
MGSKLSNGMHDTFHACDLLAEKAVGSVGSTCRNVDEGEAEDIPIQKNGICSPERRRADCAEETVEVPMRTHLERYRDSSHELRAMPVSELLVRLERAVEETRARLKSGMVLPISRPGHRNRNAASPRVCFDQDLQCLDVREWGALYPLAGLGEVGFRELESGAHELHICFEEFDEATIRFDKAADRLVFAATLQSLAHEARQDKWHEDCEATTASDMESTKDSEVEEEAFTHIAL